MDGFRSLHAWQLAQQLCVGVLEATDGDLPRCTWEVVGQLRRAVVSVDVNIVEGYALGTSPLFRRHLRIALGSAAEAHRLLAIASERRYLPSPTTTRYLRLADRTVACLFRLSRSSNLPFGGT